MEILKLPLVIAAVVVVVRVIFERAGVPEPVNNLLSIAFLHTLAAPLYIAFRISRDSSILRPYMTLIKLVGVYAVLTRLMVLPTYWLARIFEWTQPRFYGLWGPEVGPVEGFIAVPIVTALFWILASLVIGSAVGSIVILLARRSPATTGAR